MKVKTVILLSLIVLVFSDPSYTAVSSKESAKSDTSFFGKTIPAPAYAPKRFIVKFKSEGEHAVTQDAEAFLEQRGSFASATVDRSNSLDRLNQQFQVKSAKSAFIDRKGLTTTEAKQRFSQHIQAVKQNSFSRSLRTSQDVKVPDLSNVYIMETEQDIDVKQACEAYQFDPHVEYCQPDYNIEFFWVPNDPYYHSIGSWGQQEYDLWGLRNIQASEAWDISRGENIKVAVVDSGVDYNHPDIWDNIWVNPQIISDVNQDGKIDLNDADLNHNRVLDPQEFVQHMFGREVGNPMDTFGHGTHIAGTVAAVGNNNLGIIGVAPQSKIMPVKISFQTGLIGFSSNAALGLYIATNNGADVINGSWGCRCVSLPVVEDAVRYAYSLGVVSVSAAGNDQTDVAVVAPQNMADSKPIVVGASNQLNERVFFSNDGAYVDIFAPGGGVLSGPTDPVFNILSLRSAVNSSSSNYYVGNQYLRSAGTSMAAPHVAGVVALMLAQNPTLNSEEIRQAIRVSGNPIAGAFLLLSPKKVNVYQALQVNSVLRVKITDPTFHAQLTPQNGSIVIRGTAMGPNFESYQLFYLDSFNFNQWIPINQPVTSPVNNNILATWNIQNIPLSPYMIKLAAISSDGREFTDYIEVIINPPIASMVSPVPGSTLQSTPATFTWAPEAGVSAYRLTAGLFFAGNAGVYNGSEQTGTSATFSIPAGEPEWLFVRLYSKINNDWFFRDYSYRLRPPPNPATMISPVNKSTLTSSNVLFTWNASSTPAATYSVWVGRQPNNFDLGSCFVVMGNACEISGIPIDGANVYVRLTTYAAFDIVSNYYWYRTTPGARH